LSRVVWPKERRTFPSSPPPPTASRLPVRKMLTLPQGRLFGALYESILFGINSTLFMFMLYTFSPFTKLPTVAKVRLLIILVIFMLCTVHLATVMRGIWLAFFTTTAPSPIAFYADHTQPVDLTQKTVYAVVNLLGDALFIHRLFIIYGNNWKAVLPPSHIGNVIFLAGLKCKSKGKPKCESAVKILIHILALLKSGKLFIQDPADKNLICYRV